MKKKKKIKMTEVEKQAEKKAKIASAPLKPNRLPFDQGTSI